MLQSEDERVAQAAYDNPDADWFYSQIWGGEDIHLGLYRHPEESIAAASRRTMDHMAARLGERTVDDVVDLGSGYCGASRFLSSRFGARVLSVNVSPEQNQRARALNTDAGLAEAIMVVDGSYNSVPADDGSFDLAWSQDAFLHSDRRDTAIAEAARVLRPGGELLFTDPMSADDTSQDLLGPVLERLHLPSLGSPAQYRAHAAAAGLVEVGFEDHTAQLATHYGRVLQESRARMDELRRSAGEEYLKHLMRGLQNWVDAGSRGLLTWGIFHFRKP
ncbi:MAG: SAM-dependent methyltransferase [Nesterenkonia sp.]